MQTADKIAQKLNSIRDLPTLPVVAQKIGATARDPNADARQLAGIIEDDPAIMAKILKVVNSALYASAEPVTSVQHAVARMGMTAVSNIAMSTSVFSAFESAGAGDGLDRMEFWRHSISAGIAAGVVYEKARANLSIRYTQDVLHLAGLIHDIGKIILDQYFHEELTQAVLIARQNRIPLFTAEQQVMGTDHAQVGSWLGAKWNLSKDLLYTIGKHHDPAGADEKHWPIVALAHTANYICNQQKIGDSGDSTAPAFIQSIWKRLGLSVGDIPTVVDQIKEESKKSEILMSFV